MSYYVRTADQYPKVLAAIGDPLKRFFIPAEASLRSAGMLVAERAGLLRTDEAYWRLVDDFEYAAAHFVAEALENGSGK